MWIRAIGSILRILIGAGFIAAGLVKLFDPGFVYGGLTHKLGEFGNAYPWYREIILVRVERNLDLFAYLVPSAEIAAGISFLFGAFVSWSACGAAFLLINIGFAVGGQNDLLLPLHLALGLLLIVLGRAGAGLTWGLDGWLVQRMPPALVMFPLRWRLPDEFRRMHRGPSRYHPGKVHGRRR